MIHFDLCYLEVVLTGKITVLWWGSILIRVGAIEMAIFLESKGCIEGSSYVAVAVPIHVAVVG